MRYVLKRLKRLKTTTQIWLAFLLLFSVEATIVGLLGQNWLGAGIPAIVLLVGGIVYYPYEAFKRRSRRSLNG